MQKNMIQLSGNHFNYQDSPVLQTLVKSNDQFKTQLRTKLFIL